MTSLGLYKTLSIGLIKREFYAKYSKSLLGYLWVLMNPLYMSVLYSVIFSSVMSPQKSRLEYGLYVTTGLLTWNFFVDIMTKSQGIYLNYAQIIKQQRFPMLCLPFVVLGITGIDYLISFGLFFCIFFSLKGGIASCYLALLPVFILHVCYAMSLATILGLLNIFFRDIEKMVSLFIQIWFWLTPIVYFPQYLPLWMQDLLWMNPLATILKAYQSIILNQQWPKWETFLYPILLTIFFSVLLLKFYQRQKYELLDEL